MSDNPHDPPKTSKVEEAKGKSQMLDRLLILAISRPLIRFFQLLILAIFMYCCGMFPQKTPSKPIASAEDQEVPRTEKNELNLRVFSCGVENHHIIKEE